MAKGQMRSNKEVKKPKKDKAKPAASSILTKGVSATGEGAKKKG